MEFIGTTQLQEYLIQLIMRVDAQHKKIFIFGGEHGTEDIVEEISAVCRVEKLLDNDRIMQKRCIYGIEIVSPECLEKENKGEYVVFILSRYVQTMSRQLDAMGLVSEKDYFNVYAPLSVYLKKRKFENSIQAFERFVDRIPEEYFTQIPISQKNHIGVICLCEMTRYVTVFMLAQALLLRSFGYRVTLIVDAMKAFDGYYHFDGVEEFTRSCVEHILPKIKKICPDIEIAYIEQEGTAELDQRDLIKAKKTAEYVSKWFDGRADSGRLGEICDRQKLAEEILLRTLSYIKQFFNKNPVDVISVYTGIHRHRNMYMYTGGCYGIRVCSYDSGGIDKMLYSTDGVAGHSEDSAKLIHQEYFTPTEKREIIKLAQESFSYRKNSTVNDEGYNYQTVRYEGTPTEKWYDIMIPLNIAWDAAALDRDDIFSSDLEWLQKTLSYILEHTDANVMLREHPAQNAHKFHNYINLREKLPIIGENSDRICFVAAGEKINTYQYLEHCKLVLPYTSTVGLESVMMGKNVILHTKVFYQDLGIAYKASSEEEYFKAISYYLEHPEEKICTDIQNAFLAYWGQMNIAVESEYNVHHMEWLNYSLEELRKIPGMEKIIASVGAGIPTRYFAIREQLDQVRNRTTEDT